MFRGRMPPVEVLAAAGVQASARFYRGLYHEAWGRGEAAREEIFLAADPRSDSSPATCTASRECTGTCCSRGVERRAGVPDAPRPRRPALPVEITCSSELRREAGTAQSRDSWGANSRPDRSGHDDT